MNGRPRNFNPGSLPVTMYHADPGGAPSLDCRVVLSLLGWPPPAGRTHEEAPCRNTILSNKTYSPHCGTKSADLPRISTKLLGLLVAKITLLLRSSSWHTVVSEEERRDNPQRSISLIAFLFQIIANNWITFSFLVALGSSLHNGAELSNRLCAVWFRCFCSEWVSLRMGTTRSAAKHVDARAIVASSNLFIRIVTEPGLGSCSLRPAFVPRLNYQLMISIVSWIIAQTSKRRPTRRSSIFQFS